MTAGISAASTRRGFIRLLALGGVVLLAACSTLPQAGPSTEAVVNGGTAAATPAGDQAYRLVDLTEQAAIALNQANAGALDGEAATFGSLPPAAPLGRIGTGDLLQITLWEPNPTGTTLLTPPGLDVSLRVDPSGYIWLPYAGPLRVTGRTPMSVQRSIMAILTAQGHNIQAAVLDRQDVSDTAIVEGGANRPGAYPLSIGTRSLLDLIAIAGGSKLPDYATTARVSRGDAMAQAPLTDIIANPALDIPIEPGDSVMLLPRYRSFYAFGAVNRPGLFPYDATKVTLTEALADIAGLQDNLAAPRGVFIYRRSATGTGSPQTVYRLDMSKPGSFFIADLFVVRPNDIIYVSDAPVANLTKVLQTISGVSGIAVIPHNFGAPY